MTLDAPFALAPIDQQALTALPPAERAAFALQSTTAESHLRALVEKFSAITNVVDKNGREEAHRAAMSLKNARVAITNHGKGVREDAVAFQKAVVAEVERLAAITDAEEARLLKLRNDYDDEQRRIREEQERLAAQRAAEIAAHMAAIRDLPVQLANAGTERIRQELGLLARRELGEADFGERVGEAMALVDATAAALVKMMEAAQAREEQARRDEEERIQRAREEQERREELERSTKAAAEKMAALKKQEAQMTDILRMQNLGGTIADARGIDEALRQAHEFDPSTFGAMESMAKMARDLAVSKLEARLQRTLELELPRAFDEAHAINTMMLVEDATAAKLVSPAEIDWDEPAPLKPHLFDTVLAPVVAANAPAGKCDSQVLAAFRTILRELRLTRSDAEIRVIFDDELSVMPGVQPLGRRA